MVKDATKDRPPAPSGAHFPVYHPCRICGVETPGIRLAATAQAQLCFRCVERLALGLEQDAPLFRIALDITGRQQTPDGKARVDATRMEIATEKAAKVRKRSPGPDIDQRIHNWGGGAIINARQSIILLAALGHVLYEERIQLDTLLTGDEPGYEQLGGAVTEREAETLYETLEQAIALDADALEHGY